ncbi:ABC transporter substrate-binding protein [Microbacterium soli]|uniref:ABC transporter substrate-binding protein n=1 Tax=Microbacterium soli TaxID=446075 RepID=A0ABP7MVH5_9MICO
MKKTVLRSVLTLAVVGVTLATTIGCTSSKATSDSDAVIVPGVTEDSITLGIIADLTGPFASTGVPTVEGAKHYWQTHQVCERSVELVVKDTEYKTDRAKTAYAELRDDVLAIQATTATPITVVNMDDFAKDDMMVIAVPAPDLAENDNILLAGTLNDVEMMNGVSYAVDNLGVQEGDVIGAIYLNNDFGKASLVGVEEAADLAGLTLVSQPAEVTDKDMTAQITALGGAGVSAVFVAGSAGVLNSAVTIARAQGLDVPFIASAGAFDASALETSAGPGLEENTYFVAYVAPFGDGSDGPSANRAALEESGSGAHPSHWMNLGWGMATIMDQALSAACKDGDLTRAGLLAVVDGLGEVETGGAIVPLEFDLRSPGMMSYVLRPDPSMIDGLRIEEQPFIGELTATLNE